MSTAFFTTYGANSVLDGTGLPQTLYGRLHIGAPSSAGTGNEAVTSTRASMTLGTAANGVISNTNTVQWTSAAAETITHVAWWDAASGGNCWAVTPLTTSGVVLAAGLSIIANAGDFTFTMYRWGT